MFGMTSRRSRYEERSHGDYAHHPLGNPTVPMRVPAPVVDLDAKVEIEVAGSLWTVPARNAVKAALAVEAGEIETLTKLGAMPVG